MKAKHIKEQTLEKIVWKIINYTFRGITYLAIAVLFVAGLALAYTYGVGKPLNELWVVCGACVGWFAVLGFIAVWDKA